MEFKHTPVLLQECLDGLAIRPDGVYIDGTVGGGGHACRIAAQLSTQGMLIGIDRDEEALSAAGERLGSYSCRIRLVHSNYVQIKSVLRSLEIDGIDGALLDLGVSSHQLDQADRGFSYMQDVPLDMRMDRQASFSAWNVVNEYSQQELAGIIRHYGEERWASRIAQFIVRERKKEPICTTGQLVALIKAAIPAGARRNGPHPAKRTFQAIRIEVNDELNGLSRAMDEFIDVLHPGGRLCVLTFHSLEDRIVKQAIWKREHPCTCPPEFPVCVCGKTPDLRHVTRKPVTPDETELQENPRSRSAKLRVTEKL